LLSRDRRVFEPGGTMAMIVASRGMRLAASGRQRQAVGQLQLGRGDSRIRVNCSGPRRVGTDRGQPLALVADRGRFHAPLR
jgi:hypothetical protein